MATRTFCRHKGAERSVVFSSGSIETKNDLVARVKKELGIDDHVEGELLLQNPSGGLAEFKSVWHVREDDT